MVLDHMHALHIAHRDIKLENVFVSQGGDAKVGTTPTQIQTTKAKATTRPRSKLIIKKCPSV